MIHTGDDPGRDILEGSADVAFIGGFAAAVAALGSNADVVVLDTTDPQRPRPRSIAQAVGRVVRARATNPRFIAGQMRHGPRGASEFAETVDRLVGFAETTAAISGDLIGAVHDAYLGDAAVRTFLLRENPAAAKVIAKRFADARRRGLWHPLRNSIDDDLAALIAEAEQSAGLWLAIFMRVARRQNDSGRGLDRPPRNLPGAYRADANRRRAAGPASSRVSRIDPEAVDRTL